MAADKGHNSKLKDDEKKALFFHHVRKEIDIAAQIKELQNIRKSRRKTAQADKITLAKLDFAIKAMSAEKKENVVDAETSRLEALSRLNLAPGFRADWFTDTAPALDRIKKDGERAGFLGKDGKSQYLEGTDEDTAWLKGWRNGRQFLPRILKVPARNCLNRMMKQTMIRFQTTTKTLHLTVLFCSDREVNDE